MGNPPADGKQQGLNDEARVDRVLAEFGLPVGKQIDAETKRSMRSCREMGYEKGRAILADIGKQILESKTKLMLEASRGGSKSTLTPI